MSDATRPSAAAAAEEVTVRSAPAEIEALQTTNSVDLSEVGTDPELRVLIRRDDALDAIRCAHIEEPALRLDRYQLLGRFPSAASAEVFLALEAPTERHRRPVVIKWADARRKDFRLIEAALLDEAGAITHAAHPNIIPILSLMTGRMDGSYFTMPFIDGTDLRRVAAELCRRKARMPPRHALFILVELLRGLNSAHQAVDHEGTPLSIVHRDVNPANVLISSSGHVFLADFGAVHMRDRLQGETSHGLVKGKVRYLAPEYILNQSCDARADLYGAGLLFYELLTGRLAFSAEHKTETMLRIVHDGLSTEPLLKLGLDPQLAALVAQLLARDPEARAASAEALIGALESWAEEAGAFLSPRQLRDYLEAEQLYC